MSGRLEHGRRRSPLTPPDDDSSQIGVALLVDMRKAFLNAGWPAVIKSGDLTTALNAMEESPWGAMRRRQGITTHVSPRS